MKVDRHGKIVPWLAERWNTSDNQNYTFFLKRGVRFHNGRELKAADVKFVFERAMNPETKHPAAQLRGHQRHHRQGRLHDHDHPEEHQREFPPHHGAPGLGHLSARGGRHAEERADRHRALQVAEWVRGDRIVLVKNSDYHVKGLPKIDRVTYRFIPDPNAALAALKAGDVDASMFGLGPEHIPDLQKDARFR